MGTLWHKLKAWLARAPGDKPRTELEQVQRTSANQQAQDVYPLDTFDEGLLESARTQWQMGEWANLSAIGIDTLQHHPERAKLALLVAAGHQALGNPVDARKYSRLSIEWGCSKKLVSQILIAGVHNTLGRAATVAGQEQRATGHFEKSIAIVMPNTDIRLLGQTRTIRETARLGLLQKAAGMLGSGIRGLKNGPTIESLRLKMLETEFELLQGELSLAQQRQQLSPPKVHVVQNGLVEQSQEWLAEIKKKSMSQLGQDLWVLEKINYKRNGFFVEFGATDGVLLSNSWILEKEFGWEGICAEPNPKFFAKLEKNRKCIVSQHCISEITGKQIDFILADAYGGSTEYANDDMHGEKRAAYFNAGHVVKLTTISLDDFLEYYGAPLDIDYLSIDTEGSEFEILRVFPFEKWNIRFLTIEHNYTARRIDLRQLLENNGYCCVEQKWDDWYEKKH